MTNLYDRPGASMSGLIFMVMSVILFLGAIGIFVWMVVDASEEHLVKNILYGSAFIACTAGLLLYVLFVNKAPRTCAAILWISMALGTAAFVVGLCLKTNVDRAQLSTGYGWEVSRAA